VENKQQLLETARAVKELGATGLRGGAFKPRTSPYAYQGMGEAGLKLLREVGDQFGLPIVTEVMDPRRVEVVDRYTDMIQIGARNMQNFSLLRRAGKAKLPVLLKRGLSATLDEWLLAAEYIMAEGNYQIVLCERGIRTFAQHTRNTLDLAAIPAVRRISHLPVIVDPSHGTGKNFMVTPLARAGVAVGADGLIIEVHDQPEHALSDGAQALTLDQYEQLVDEVRSIYEVIAPVSV
jgi:3-deoxy-7-phosphoheptulonate synthase